MSVSAAVQADTAVILEARKALSRGDRNALLAARATVTSNHHPLAPWVDYWELGNRLVDAQQKELDAFYSRWRGTYVEDRLRNDWLLELGRRRDWRNFRVDFPHFIMSDDREVRCYALLTDHLKGRRVHNQARQAWWAQRKPDDGCALLARTLYKAKVFRTADVWRKARLAVAANRPRSARPALDLLGGRAAKLAKLVLNKPARFEKQRFYRGRTNAELMTLALMRLAKKDFKVAATRLSKRWEHQLPKDLVAWAWAVTAKRAALNHAPEATRYFQSAFRWAAKGKASTKDWPRDILAWRVRAALRSQDRQRWPEVLKAISAMNQAQQRAPVWVYWKARALDALSHDATPSKRRSAQRSKSRQLLASISRRAHFYGMLAAEEMGRRVTLPRRPAPVTANERKAAASHPGLKRALLLLDIGLRSEGVREWNFSRRAMNDRQLLAAAQLACESAVWDRCISTSARTRSEIDIRQRFPMPFRHEVLAQVRQSGLDPAYVYGLIRQESRFISDIRSSAGATGLMQLMPATARWTAKKIGIDLAPTLLTKPAVNLKLGTGYLKLVLDTFSGSQTLAAAAYNAGPNRSRRWRQGPILEPAIWAENIPFHETRNYVKKVLANATVYGALLTGTMPSLKERLGSFIGPPTDDEGNPEDRNLP